MPKQRKPVFTPSQFVPATISVTVVVDDQAIDAQSMLDLAGIAIPSTRPDWSPVLFAASLVQRRLAIGEWNELGLHVGVLVDLVGMQLSASEAAELLTEVIARTKRDGPQMGFMALAHRLVVIAGK